MFAISKKIFSYSIALMLGTPILFFVMRASAADPLATEKVNSSWATHFIKKYAPWATDFTNLSVSSDPSNGNINLVVFSEPKDFYSSSELEELKSFDYPSSKRLSKSNGKIVSTTITPNSFDENTFSPLCPGRFTEVTPGRLQWVNIPGCGTSHAKVSQFFTLADNVKTLGPQLTYDEELDSSYVKLIFRQIIQSAHKIIQESDIDSTFKRSPDPHYNANYTYYSWLVAALTTPLHESKLLHFRRSKKEMCDQNLNSLWVHKIQGQGTTQKIISKNFKSPMQTILPNCDELPDDSGDVTQLLNSVTHGDFGIMQINFAAHKGSEFVKPYIALNTYAMIDEGLSYLFDPFNNGWAGFLGIRKKISLWQAQEDKKLREASEKGLKYAPTCNFNYNPFKKSVVKKGANGSNQLALMNYDDSREEIYSRLVGATWTGYNQGGMGKEDVCRFMTGHDFDRDFLNHFKEIVVYGDSYYHKYLPEGSLERLALDEIVHNFRRSHFDPKVLNNLPERSKALDFILNQTTINTKAVDYKVGKTNYKPTHLLLADTSFYHVPSKSDSQKGISNKCGEIENRVGSSSMLLETVLQEGEQIIYNSQESPDQPFTEFVGIRIPKYSAAVKFSTPKIVRLGRGVTDLNVRTSPKVTINCNAKNIELYNSQGKKHNCLGQWINRDKVGAFEINGAFAFSSEDNKWIKVLVDEKTGTTGWVYNSYVDVEAAPSREDNFFNRNCLNRDIFYIPKSTLLRIAFNKSETPIKLIGLPRHKRGRFLKKYPYDSSDSLKPVLQFVNFWQEYNENPIIEINGNEMTWRDIPRNKEFLSRNNNERTIQNDTGEVYDVVENDYGELWYGTRLGGQYGYFKAEHLLEYDLVQPDENQLAQEGRREN